MRVEQPRARPSRCSARVSRQAELLVLEHRHGEQPPPGGRAGRLDRLQPGGALQAGAELGQHEAGQVPGALAGLLVSSSSCRGCGRGRTASAAARRRAARAAARTTLAWAIGTASCGMESSRHQTLAGRADRGGPPGVLGQAGAGAGAVERRAEREREHRAGRRPGRTGCGGDGEQRARARPRSGSRSAAPPPLEGPAPWRPRVSLARPRPAAGGRLRVDRGGEPPAEQQAATCGRAPSPCPSRTPGRARPGRPGCTSPRG